MEFLWKTSRRTFFLKIFVVFFQFSNKISNNIVRTLNKVSEDHVCSGPFDCLSHHQEWHVIRVEFLKS